MIESDAWISLIRINRSIHVYGRALLPRRSLNFYLKFSKDDYKMRVHSEEALRMKRVLPKIPYLHYYFDFKIS